MIRNKVRIGSSYYGGGGGSPSAPFSRHLYYVIGGNEFTNTNIGIKYLTEIPATVPASLVGLDLTDPLLLDTLPDGIGIIETVGSSARHLSINVNPAYLNGAASMYVQRGQIVFCPGTLSIVVEDSDPETSITFRVISTLV
jgi:hypothetical protein